MSRWHHRVERPMDEEQRPRVAGDGPARRQAAHRVTARAQVDPGGELGEGRRERLGDRQPREPERLPGEPSRVGGGGRADERRAAVPGGRRGEDRPDRSEGVAEEGAAGHLGPGEERIQRGQRVVAELCDADRQRLGRVVAVPADIEREDVVPGGMEDLGVRERPVAVRLPAVDEDDARSGGPIAGRDEPRRQFTAGGVDDGLLERQAAIGRRQLARPAPREGPRACGR